MGSKTETVTKVSVTNLFKSDDDLFVKEMVRTYALTKSIEPTVMLKSMILNLSSFFNNKMFEKFGVLAKGSLVSSTITENTIQQQLPSGSTINYYVTIDENGNAIVGTIYTIKQYLDENYTYDDSYTQTISETYTVTDPTNNNNEDVTVNETIYKYQVNSSSTDYYKYDSYTTNDDGSYHLKMINENDDTDIVYVDTPIDTRVYYLVKYSYNNKILYTLIPDSDALLVTDYSRDAFVLGLKKDGNDIANDKYKQVVMMKFGLGKKGEDDFEKNILDNSQIKDAFLTYSVQYDSSKYNEIINQIYGNLSDLRSVKYEGQDFTIIYKYLKNTNHNNTTIYMVSIINDNKLGAGDYTDSVIHVIIPTDFITKNRTIREKYDALKDMLSLFARSEVKIKKKWYQTGFFGFIFKIASIALAIATGNPELVLISIGAEIAINVLIKNPTLKLIANIILAIAIMAKGKLVNVSKISKINWAKLLLNTTQNLFMVENQRKVRKVYSQIQQMNKQTEDMYKAIQQIKKQAIYNPLSLNDFYYNAMYELPYRQFDYIQQSTEINYNRLYNSF